MPHFTLQISPQGALLDAWVSVSSARHAALTAIGQIIPNPVRIRALVDTGASATCIDHSVLQMLSLNPTGSATVVTPSTQGIPVIADQYDVGLIVPPAGPNQIPLIVSTLPVISAELLASQGFHALIGREYLGTMRVFVQRHYRVVYSCLLTPKRSSFSFPKFTNDCRSYCRLR